MGKVGMVQEGTQDEELVKTNLNGALYFLAMQWIKVITFVLNSFIVSKVAAEILGVATIQMEFLRMLAVFVLMQVIRNFSMRSEVHKLKGEEKKRELEYLWSLSWTSSAVGCALSLLIGVCFLFFSSEKELNLPGYSTCVWLVVVSCCVEYLAEPFFNDCQNNLELKVRVNLEGAYFLAKTISTFLFLTYTNLGLVGFGLGFLLGSLAWTGGYWLHYLRNSKAIHFAFATSLKRPHVAPQQLKEMKDKANDKENEKEKESSLLFALFWQFSQKLLLQQNQSALLKADSDLVQQGYYSVVSNLGALLARLFFAPIEEKVLVLVAKLLQTSSPAADLAWQLLTLLLSFMLRLGMAIVLVGPPASPILLYFLYGPSKIEALSPRSLLLVPCADGSEWDLRGVRERERVGGAAQEIERNLFGAFFHSLLFSFFFLRFFQTKGLLVANILNFGVRICFSVYWITVTFMRKNKIESKEWMAVLPSKEEMALFLLNAAALYLVLPSFLQPWTAKAEQQTSRSLSTLLNCLPFLLIFAALAASQIAFWILRQRKRLSALWSKLSQNKAKQQ